MSKPPFWTDFLRFLRTRNTKYEILDTRPVVVDVLADGSTTNRRLLKPGMVLDSRRRVIDYIARTRETRTIAAGKIEIIEFDLVTCCETRTFYTKSGRRLLEKGYRLFRGRSPLVRGTQS